MSTVSPTQATTSTNADGTVASGGIQQMDLDHFLKLMIAEMQNQDPLNPMDNAEMLAQISQIREIGATDKLSDTLSRVLAGQELTTASSIIGTEVVALADDGTDVRGVVNRISIEVDGDTGDRALSARIDGVATATTDALVPGARVAFTAKQAGEAANNVTILFAHDESVTQGAERVEYDGTVPGQATLTIRIDEGHTTAADVVRTLRDDPIAGELFEAEVFEGTDGAGLISRTHTATTEGGEGHTISLDNIREIIQ